jgi:8-oxo-dGTP pyrophosphatase MutT (NUDIX family)
MKQIKKGLEACKVVIVLCSPESIRRPWVAFEAGAAWLSKGTRLILLCHSGMHPNDLPTPYSSLQAKRSDSKGVAFLYQQITEKFDQIKREPTSDRIDAAVQRLDMAVQKIIVQRDLRERVTGVMALPYRDSAVEREFLLVRTSSGGKWTFPKGSIKSGSDMSEYLDLLRKELFDEGGAAGQVFDDYFGPFSYQKNSGEPREVLAFPVAVQRSSVPRETARSPQWCNIETARKLLTEGRANDTARGLTGALEFVARFKGAR